MPLCSAAHLTGCPTPLWCTCWCGRMLRWGAGPAGAPRAAAGAETGRAPLDFAPARLGIWGRYHATCPAIPGRHAANCSAMHGPALAAHQDACTHQDAGARGNNNAVPQPVPLLLHPALHEVLKVALLLRVGCNGTQGIGGPPRLQLSGAAMCAQGMLLPSTGVQGAAVQEAVVQPSPEMPLPWQPTCIIHIQHQRARPLQLLPLAGQQAAAGGRLIHRCLHAARGGERAGSCGLGSGFRAAHSAVHS